MKPEPLKNKRIGAIDIGNGIDNGILNLEKGVMKIPKEIQLNRPLFDSKDVKSAVQYLKKALKVILGKNLNVENRIKANRFIDEAFHDVTKED